ncbi:hypothetical protein OESDEN_20668 [Oesophagostomum dentatum]|uniref:Uncharacterized protein n=1 Tax=Oesophagostomum dentatum TaxID=61180 RepID=A0A0B1S439_OESDE|nr:hypothetical protein OESDEN_20668 [Oesophagostomum dentatum]
MAATFTAIDLAPVLVTVVDVVVHVREAVIAAGAVEAQGEDAAVRAAVALLRKDQEEDVIQAVLAAAGLQTRRVARDAAADHQNVISVLQRALPKRHLAEAQHRRRRGALVDLSHRPRRRGQSLRQRERVAALLPKMIKEILRAAHLQRKQEDLVVPRGKVQTAIAAFLLVVINREAEVQLQKRMVEANHRIMETARGLVLAVAIGVDPIAVVAEVQKRMENVEDPPAIAVDLIAINGKVSTAVALHPVTSRIQNRVLRLSKVTYSEFSALLHLQYAHSNVLCCLRGYEETVAWRLHTATSFPCCSFVIYV